MARSKDRVGDYHRQFADKVIEQIKAGTAPWQKPWKPGERSLPENLTTERAYRGGNSLYLSVEAIHRGYTDNRWATYRQIEAAGGHVKKGEKGAKVLFFEARTEQAKDDQGNPKLDDKGSPVERSRPVVRMYTVFNAEQTGGLPARTPASPAPEWRAHDQAAAIIEASGVDVRHQAGNRAYYNVRTDQVLLPEPGQFPSAAGYYHTAIHELGHATGHPDRLDRELLHKQFGSPEYAREELRAEIAAMMTGEKIGLGHEPQNGIDYVAGWVKALEDDPREIYRAASDAEKISRHLIEPARERLEQRETTVHQQMLAQARELERNRPETVVLTRTDAERVLNNRLAAHPDARPRLDALERLTNAPLPAAAGADRALRLDPSPETVGRVLEDGADSRQLAPRHLDLDAVETAVYGERFEEREQAGAAAALQAATDRRQAPGDFNRNIELAADHALENLRQLRPDSRPPQKLIHDLEAVRQFASNSDYDGRPGFPDTPDFRAIRAGLQNYAVDDASLNSAQRKRVLAIADNFAHQAQNHGLTRETGQEIERGAGGRDADYAALAAAGGTVVLTRDEAERVVNQMHDDRTPAHEDAEERLASTPLPLARPDSADAERIHLRPRSGAAREIHVDRNALEDAVYGAPLHPRDHPRQSSREPTSSAPSAPERRAKDAILDRFQRESGLSEAGRAHLDSRLIVQTVGRDDGPTRG